ncbi:hypothetical protein C8J56DRAFT_895461 [Mycena floridula]|nr:hypothetical protein C8J56DRAFT_895461 [Mycena floridula]
MSQLCSASKVKVLRYCPVLFVFDLDRKHVVNKILSLILNRDGNLVLHPQGQLCLCGQSRPSPWPVNALMASYAPVASYTPVANYALMASVTLGYSLSTDIKDRLDSEDKNKETQYGRWTSNTCQDETHLSHPIDWQFRVDSH